MIFFEDRRALEEFTLGNFEFGADVSAVAITAAASGTAGTEGATAGASGGGRTEGAPHAVVCSRLQPPNRHALRSPELV